MRKIFFLVAIIISCLSCKKDKSQAGQIVEVYLLKTYQPVSGKCQVNPSTSVLGTTAIIKNEDILEYSQADHKFKLSTVAAGKVAAFTDFVPFAVAVDGKPVYYGIFKQYYSSSSCDNSIIMHLDFASSNKIVLNLGYPGDAIGAIDDQRNNPILIATLAKQGKLR